MVNAKGICGKKTGCQQEDNQIKKGGLSMEKICYSVKEAAQLIGVSSSVLYREIREKNFPAITIGRRVLVPEKMIREYVEKKIQEAKNDEQKK